MHHDKAHTLLLGGRLLPLETPVVMGIVNVTPDSFFAGSRTRLPSDISARAEAMAADGATILDVGACSTRPGSAEVSAGEEWERLSVGLRAIADTATGLPVSVDTFRAEIARRAVEEFGVAIVNDVSGGADPEMFSAVAALHVPYVLSHIQGTVATMTDHCLYADLIPDMLRFLAARVQELHLLGVSDVIVDPGFGFAKTTEQCWQVMAHLDAFSAIGCPVLAGVSRKSMLCKPLGITPSEALNATTAAHMLALERGASILRVHDVREAVQCVKIHQCIIHNS